MSVTTYKRCHCVGPRVDRKGDPVLNTDGNPKTGELGDRCPKLKQSTHGSWYFYFSIPRPGRDPDRVRRGGFTTKGEAKSEGERLFNEATREGIDVNSKETVEEYLRRWLEAQAGLKRSTANNYRGHIDNHLIPHIGAIRLTDLRAQHIDAMFRAVREANEKRQADRLRALQLRALRDEAHTGWKAAPKPHGGYNKRAEIRAFRARLKAEWHYAAAQLREARKGTSHRKDTNVPTQHRIRATLSIALTDAVRQRRITTNWAQLVSLPSTKRPKALMWTDARIAEWRRTGTVPSPVMVWTPEQVGQFLDHVADDRLFPLWHLITFRGLRRGEATAIPWTEVDLEQGLINITQQIVAVSYEPYTDTPKADSERTIVLDETTRRLLVGWKARQDQEREELTSQGKWVETGRVFTTEENGSTYHPEWISRRFRRLAKNAGLPPIRLHDLRHEAATLALTAGTDIKVVQEMLGHSTITLTADTYTSVVPALSRAAAEAAVAIVPRSGRKCGLRVVEDDDQSAA
ncbi:site-specific integrase [Streptomyces gilvus]|uniref:site-specific integrase n=1 Tax=Streptomyces gilvus TaxID=2920937 RepID=UPI001F10BFD8|nr:tyrosine-type recombinase/integrase [Streptomyces sp. CME 23]MCH5677966.1 site-specific integrase [Streptomyces sp. CME 23]